MSNQQNTTARDARVAARSEGFVSTRLTGPVACRAYGIGNAVRLGNVTLVVGDRQAAASIARAAIFVEDLAPRPGYTYPGRRFPYRGRENSLRRRPVRSSVLHDGKRSDHCV